MPATPATTTENRAIVTYLESAMKARRGGGGKGPGSRGGHFWRDASGDIRYGPQPHQVLPRAGQGQRVVTARHGAPAAVRAAVAGQRAVRTGVGGGSGKPRAGELRAGYRIKPQTAGHKLQGQKRMLAEMDRVIRTGRDPHGNKLDPKAMDQLSLLATGLRTDLRGLTGHRKKEIATKEVHTGVMVAFYLDTFSPDAAVRLQIPGGETWDALHLTLAYLGDSTVLGPDAEGQLYRSISEFARSSSPLEGMVSGIGLFNNTEEGETNAFVALFDSPALPDFRTRLMGMLQANGIMPVQNHGFTPHITLQYLPKGQPIPAIGLPAMPMIFNKVTVKWGDKRTDFSLGLVEKEIKSEIVARAAGHPTFTVFKDAKGQYRWVGVSSSAAKDHDGETISQKALADDVARKDVTGDYGPINWWHVQKKMKIGICDFNAMDGPLLVESGTFVNDRVAQLVEKAINNGAFKPALSLEFKHDQPARKEIPIPGLVFNNINRVGRALLPAEIASNPLTRFLVYSSSPTAKNKVEVEKSMLTDEEKRKKALDYFGPEFLSALESDNETAVKAAMGMGMVFKAMAPSTDPTKKKDDPAPEPDPAAPVVVDKADPEPDPLDPAMVADLGADSEIPAEGGEGGFEDSPADAEADAIMQGLYDNIAKIFLANNQDLAAKLTEALNGVTASATKEVNDQLATNTLALKEMTTAFTQVLGENTALKARLDALEGKQPPVVQQRVSQAKTQPVTDPAVIAALKEQNRPTVTPGDPFKVLYDAWAASGINPNQPAIPQG